MADYPNYDVRFITEEIAPKKSKKEAKNSLPLESKKQKTAQEKISPSNILVETVKNIFSWLTNS